jgi:hypothetical protein
MNYRVQQVGFCILAAAMLAFPFLANAQGNVVRAIAIVQGPAGSGIEGVVIFIQSPADHNHPIPTVDIVARI